MKKLKLLLFTLFSVISLSLFSQTQVTVTNTSSPNVCDGTATLDTANVNLNSIWWQGGGQVIQQGGYVLNNLCPGTYVVNFYVNGNQMSIAFVITSPNPCNSFSGTLTIVNSLDSTSCDGSMAVAAVGGTAPYTYQWNTGATTQLIGNLCPGGYYCYLVDANGCTFTAYDSVGVMSPNYGDTLIITGGGNCNNQIATLSTTIENCWVNYNAIDTAYLSTVILPTNPFDSLTAVWILVDTNGMLTTIVSYYNQFNAINGCYGFTLTLHCSQKTLNIKTLIVHDDYYLNFVGIDELNQPNKTIVRVIDMMGRECNPESGKVQIIQYSDGTTQKVIRN